MCAQKFPVNLKNKFLFGINFEHYGLSILITNWLNNQWQVRSRNIEGWKILDLCKNLFQRIGSSNKWKYLINCQNNTRRHSVDLRRFHFGSSSSHFFQGLLDVLLERAHLTLIFFSISFFLQGLVAISKVFWNCRQSYLLPFNSSIFAISRAVGIARGRLELFEKKWCRTDCNLKNGLQISSWSIILAKRLHALTHLFEIYVIVFT